MSNTNMIFDSLGPTSKSTLLNLALNASDLVGQVDFHDSLTKENIVSVQYINNKPVTKIRIPNNVIIYKEDLKEIPLLLEFISQGDLKGSNIPLASFPIETQNNIIIIFMMYYGYVNKIGTDYYFNPHIEDLFNTTWWLNLFQMAKLNTINYIEQEVLIGNQPIKNRDLIVESGLISINEFKKIQPEPGMDLVWALGIYFFEKIVRNWILQELPEIIETETLMDADLDPGKYVKVMDAKKFFIQQLRIFLGLRPSSVWFGSGYHSKFKELIQKKISTLSKNLVLEELKYFTDYMNLIYSNENNLLNGPVDSGTEPFTVLDLSYSETEHGPNTLITVSIKLKINTYSVSQIVTLPVTTRIN